MNLDFSTRLVEHLRQTGHKIVLVKIGDIFQKETDCCYYLNPSKSEDYRNLITELDKLNQIPQQIIHLWTLTEDSAGRIARECGFNEVENATNWGFYSLIHLAQAIGDLKINCEVLLKVITNNLHSVTGAERLHPEKALVLGPVKIIPQEYPNIKCVNIDIEIPTPDSREENQLFNWLSSELDAGASPIR